MRNHRGTFLLVISTLAIAILTLSTQPKANYTQETTNHTAQEDEYQRRMELSSRYPTVNFDAAEPAEPEQKQSRRKKNSYYDKTGFAIEDMTPRAAEEGFLNHWDLHLPALPVAQSTAIIIGEVISSAAYLSNDKSGIYTELTTHVTEVLKDSRAELVRGQDIPLDRLGGFVKYPAGHKRLHRVIDQNIPKLGTRYVLFLKRSELDENFHLVTGYELANGEVYPLDDASQMKVYKGMAETDFLKAVQEALVNSRS